MNVLDSPLEALTFNYASFGFFTIVNNLWTWVALLTAALSLWKIRAKPHLPPPPPPPPPLPLSNDRSLSGPPPSTEQERPVEYFAQPEAAEASKPTAGVVAAGGDGDVDGVTKGKFTVYYDDDSECEMEEELREPAAYSDGGGGYQSEWWENWDNMLKMRVGVNGWYMYQDLTELNGNVVRLWDGGLGNGKFAREARYSSSIIVW